MQNPQWQGKKGETECRFIRHKSYVKHSIFIFTQKFINCEWRQQKEINL